MKKSNKRLAILGAVLVFAAALVVAYPGLRADAARYWDGYFTNVLAKGQLKAKGAATFESTVSGWGLAQFNAVRVKPYVVNSYTQLTPVGGTSVFVVDPALGNHFRVDIPAIYASCTAESGMTTFKNALTGLTVVGGAAAPTATNDGYTFTVEQWGNNTTSPWALWVPQTSGVTSLANLLASYVVAGTGGSQWQTASSVSDWPVYNQYDSATYQYNYDSSVSYTPKSKFIQKSSSTTGP